MRAVCVWEKKGGWEAKRCLWLLVVISSLFVCCALLLKEVFSLGFPFFSSALKTRLRNSEVCDSCCWCCSSNQRQPTSRKLKTRAEESVEPETKVAGSFWQRE